MATRSRSTRSRLAAAEHWYDSSKRSYAYGRLIKHDYTWVARRLLLRTDMAGITDFMGYSSGTAGAWASETLH